MKAFAHVYKFSFKENGIWQEEHYSELVNAEQHRLLRMRSLIWGSDISEVSEIKTITVWN